MSGRLSARDKEKGEENGDSRNRPNELDTLDISRFGSPKTLAGAVAYNKERKSTDRLRSATKRDNPRELGRRIPIGNRAGAAAEILSSVQCRSIYFQMARRY